MASIRALELAAATLDKVPAEYRAPFQLLCRSRNKKFILAGFGMFLLCILAVSQIQTVDETSNRLINEDNIILPNEDIAEDIERDVAERPKSFKWRPSPGKSEYLRLFYNEKAMWGIDLAKKSMDKLKLTDSRSQACQRSFITTMEVDVVLDVARKNVAYFPFTLASILRSAAYKIGRIYVVQDGSLVDDAVRKIEEFVWEQGKVVVLRTPFKSLAQARNEAMEKASGEIIVFFTSGVLASVGWLDPLLEQVVSFPKNIAVPIYDRVDYWEDNAFYYPSLHMVINTLRQDMNVHLYPLFDRRDSAPVAASPAVRGDVFAVMKKEFQAAGGYDTSLRGTGAAHAELTMRHWLCYGEVYACECSRVAIQTIGEQRIESLEDALYIAKLWTPDAVPNTDAQALGAAVKRAAQKQVLRKCKNPALVTTRLVPQALDTVANGDTVLHAGKLKVDTGICIVPRANGIVFLGDCDHKKYGLTEIELEFKYTRYGYLTFGNDMCLTTGGSDASELMILNLETCVSGEARQRWAFSEKRVLKSVKGGCLKEVSNPKNPSEEITQRIPCEYIYDEWGGIKLVRWEFVAV